MIEAALSLWAVYKIRFDLPCFKPVANGQPNEIVRSEFVNYPFGSIASSRETRLIGRNRALEVLLSSEDIRADQAEAYGYINRALLDAELDAFVEALATRIAKFDKWAIAQTKRLVNTSLPPDVELGAGWDACIASLGRPAAQEGIKALIARGFHKPGDVENRLGYYLGQIAR